MVPTPRPRPREEVSVLSERDDPRLGKVVRRVSAGVGSLLFLWALSDDPLIGGGPGFGFTQALVLGIGVLLAASGFASLAWNARALALVLSMGFVVVVGEVAVRVLYSSRYERPYELDEKVLYRLVPGTLREYRREPINGGDRILYQVNEDGYRGEELAAQPYARIVVYGDSFIQAEFSALENTFSERLEYHVSQRLGFDVEVVNAGVAGFGPDQALRKMERELPALEPDLVVVAVFAGNDFGDPIRNKLFRVDGSGTLKETAFTIEPEERRVMEVGRRELILKRVLREAVYALADRLGLHSTQSSEVDEMDPRERLDFFREQHLREYEEYIVRGDDVVRELAWDSYDADVSLTPKSDAARYKARLMDAVLGQMQVLTSSLSIPMVLLPIPHPIDVGGHDTGTVDSEKYPEYESRGLVRILEEIAARRSIPVVDLFTPFSEQGSETVYFRGFDDHWNDHGQDFAGELVADFLIRRNLLAGTIRDALPPRRGG
ncbi:MAG: hypothetical protein CL908_06695 [Deltaproteobacteria bacterium]|nr:hypothetical protein [Deltaproteobacteria bacterium]